MPAPDLISLFVAPLERLGLSYMVTGAVAAIIYGEPRLTNDIDIVIGLAAEDAERLHAAFAGEDFYVPLPQTLVEEAERPRHGHFNVVHVPTALKADFYPMGEDPLHRWAMDRRRRIAIGEVVVAVAPPEYVILRKLEYFRAGGSDKHRTDVQAMLRVLGRELDRAAIEEHAAPLGLDAEWRALTSSSPDV